MLSVSDTSDPFSVEVFVQNTDEASQKGELIKEANKVRPPTQTQRTTAPTGSRNHVEQNRRVFGLLFTDSDNQNQVCFSVTQV